MGVLEGVCLFVHFRFCCCLIIAFDRTQLALSPLWLKTVTFTPIYIATRLKVEAAAKKSTICWCVMHLPSFKLTDRKCLAQEYCSMQKQSFSLNMLLMYIKKKIQKVRHLSEEVGTQIWKPSQYSCCHEIMITFKNKKKKTTKITPFFSH